jgi:hypothetical protein
MIQDFINWIGYPLCDYVAGALFLLVAFFALGTDFVFDRIKTEPDE